MAWMEWCHCMFMLSVMFFAFCSLITILVAGTRCVAIFSETQILGINTELAEWVIGLGGELSL